MRKMYFIIFISITILLLSIGIGFATWGIINNLNRSSEGEFTGYTIIDLEDTADTSIDAFQYKTNGFVGPNQYSTSFNVTFDLKEKSEAYNVILELIDEDSFLSNVTLTYTYGGNTVNGNKTITINNINSNREITITYTITTQSSDWSETGPIYVALEAGKNMYIKATASSSNGTWSITKKIDLIATLQNYVLISIPDQDTTIFTYTGTQQTYNIASNPGYTITNNTRTNAGSQTVTVSLNEGYQWENGTTNDQTYSFEILKKQLSISAVNNTILYGDEPTNAGITSAGFVNGESYSSLSGSLSYSYNYNQYGNVGNYLITPSGYTSTNYTISYNTGTLTVSQREIGITWTNIEFTYDKQSHVPSATATNLVNNDTIDITVTGNQVNAGVNYTATATQLTGEKAQNYKLPTNKTKQFKINKRNIIVAADDLSFDSSKRTWAQISPEITFSLTGVIDGDTVTATAIGMHNGHFKFGTTDSSYNGETLVTETNVVGSTYLLNISLSGTNATNYIIESSPKLKYKTTLIGSSYNTSGTYYTIEEAITNSISGTIYFPGDGSGTTTYVYTSFCALTGSDYPYSNTTYSLTKKMFIPQKADISNESTNGSTSGNVFCALYISNNITINANSDIIISGNLQSTSTISTRGVLVNDGTINVASGKKFYAFGFVKSSSLNRGTINCSNGSLIMECVKIYDWPGGNTATSINGKCFPTNAWSMHNIATKLVINKGAVVTACAMLNVASNDIYVDNIYVIKGTSSANKYLFNINNGSITKSIRNLHEDSAWNASSADWKALFSVSGSNQKFGQRDMLEINGTIEDGGFSISVSGYSFNTSSTISLPISTLDVFIRNNGNLSLNNSDYLFLPGSSLTIDNGGILTTKSGIDLSFETWNNVNSVTCAKPRLFKTYCIDKVDSYLMINGSFVCNGNLGGQIRTTVSGATLQLGTNKATFLSLCGAHGARDSGSTNCAYMIESYYARAYDSNDVLQCLKSNTLYTSLGNNHWSGTFNSTTSDSNISYTCSVKSCLLPNTLVTMADGTQKEIQYLIPGDMVMVFNHETGKLDIAPVTFNEYEEAQWFNVIHLVFDNGSNIGVISEHGFFDLDTMKYEYIDEYNYQSFIGHKFYTIDGTPTTLIDAYVEQEYTMCYSLPSYYHLNLFTDGILSMPGGITGLFNIFEYSETLQYDQELMEQDINTYGLFNIEELEQLGVTEEMFNAYAGKYLKVALGKGILTEEYLMYLIERYGKYTE